MREMTHALIFRTGLCGCRQVAGVPIAALLGLPFHWAATSWRVRDNRRAMHIAVNGYDGVCRLMHRSAIKVERPMSARSENS